MGNKMEPAIQGKFIVFDGIDCCGKETQAIKLAEYLFDHPDDQYYKLLNVVITRNPSQSNYTVQIRDSLHDIKDPYEKAKVLADLFVKDRWWHLDNTVLPNKKAGMYVLCVRYMYSTLAFQQTQGMSFEELKAMHDGMAIPDAVFFIDISAEEMMRRKEKRLAMREEEMFEKLEFQRKLRQNYLDLKERLPNHPIYIINGERSIEEIQKDVRAIVDKLIQADYPKKN
ncbi:dTMP kinase [Candidatus Woesearchaeota archaeon]|nr:dTMP kinase [Candidatus Woesearchaeota archaeon]